MPWSPMKTTSAGGQRREGDREQWKSLDLFLVVGLWVNPITFVNLML